jgi:hypothetical protein
MAGPYHAAQSPEPFPITVPIGTLGLTCLHCQLRLPVCPILACTFSHEPKPAVLTRSSPAIKWTNALPTILFASPRYITPSSVFSSQGRLTPAMCSSDTGECLAYLRFRSGTELIVHRLHFVLSVFNSLYQAAPTNRRSPPPNLSGNQPLICFILFSNQASQTSLW